MNVDAWAKKETSRQVVMAKKAKKPQILEAAVPIPDGVASMLM